MDKYKKEYEFAKKLAYKAGEIMLEYSALDKQVKIKDDFSPVTIADEKVNRLVIEELTKKFDHEIIGEEESTTEYGKNDIVWICDPIDGTKAFIAGIPSAMFSLALVEKGTPVLGVAYDPYLNRLFHAYKGKGSFCNESKILVSQNNLDGHHVAVVSDAARLFDSERIIKKLLQTGAKAICAEGAVYKSCHVAEGKFVGYFSDLPKTHDMAAVSVIVEEAGGKVTATNGSELDYSKPFIGAIVSNGVVHQKLVEISRVN